MFVHKPTQSLLLDVPEPTTVLSTLGAQNARLVHAPAANIVVRYNVDTVRVLRNMGIDAPSPIWTDYSWPGKYKPFDHQRVMADVMSVHPRCFNLSEMGTGKTYAALWAADYLMSIGEVKRCAVLTPLSTMHSVWEQDIFKILMHRSSAVIHGERDRRIKRLNMDVDFYIINHHGIGIKEVAQTLRKRKDIDLIILDEASVFRNHRTNIYRYLEWVLEKIGKRFWLMTGTPTPTEPPDAWALARLIAPENVPRHKGVFERQTMLQVNAVKSVPVKGYEKIVYDAMQPAVRFKKADCMTLPTMTVIRKQTQMSVQQKDAFRQMQDAMIADVKAGVQISAVHAADRVNKLRQILCGVIHDTNTGAYLPLDNTPRLTDLIATIHEASAKVIVIAPFKGILRLLDKQLTAAGITVGVMNGDVSVMQRRIIIDEFKNNVDPHVLLCHPRVMAHGLNLTEADMLISYAPIFSYDEWAQVIERMNRAGQTRKMTVVRMAAHPVEWAIYRALDDRGTIQQNVLDLYAEVTTRKV
jgi:SNF2 family DNA or RNA helicase